MLQVKSHVATSQEFYFFSWYFYSSIKYKGMVLSARSSILSTRRSEYSVWTVCVIMDLQFVQSQSRFIIFYNKQHSGRKLTWLYNKSKVCSWNTCLFLVSLCAHFSNNYREKS